MKALVNFQHGDTLKKIASDVDKSQLPIMEKLKETLIGLFEEEDARGIVFAQERYTTTALIQFINDDDQLSAGTTKIVSGRFGHCSSAFYSNKAMTEKESRRICTLLLSHSARETGGSGGNVRWSGNGELGEVSIR